MTLNQSTLGIEKKILDSMFNGPDQGLQGFAHQLYDAFEKEQVAVSEVPATIEAAILTR